MVQFSTFMEFVLNKKSYYTLMLSVEIWTQDSLGLCLKPSECQDVPCLQASTFCPSSKVHKPSQFSSWRHCFLHHLVDCRAETTVKLPFQAAGCLRGLRVSLEQDDTRRQATRQVGLRRDSCDFQHKDRLQFVLTLCV